MCDRKADGPDRMRPAEASVAERCGGRFDGSDHTRLRGELNGQVDAMTFDVVSRLVDIEFRCYENRKAVGRDVALHVQHAAYEACLLANILTSRARRNGDPVPPGGLYESAKIHGAGGDDA